MVNIAAQILTLLCALIVNFVVPFLFGLHEYGLFIQQNVLVFFFQKLTDTANEPLIGRVDSKLVFPVSLSVCTLVWIAFIIVNSIYELGNIWLLGAMLLSSSVLLSMYALRKINRIVAYLIAFLGVFCLSITLRLLNVFPFEIEQILILTNALPALAGAILLIPSSRGSATKDEIAKLLYELCRSFPSMLSLTLVYNLFTNVFPFILSKTLPAESLGLFRVIASLVQSATSFFPINVKAIFVAFTVGGQPDRLYRTLMSFSLLFFTLMGSGVCLLAALFPKIYPYTALICTLPVLYWAVLSERYLLAMKETAYVRSINLLVGGVALAIMPFVKEVDQAVVCYAFGFSLYASVLLIKIDQKINAMAVIWVCGLSLVVAYFFGVSSVPAIIYLAGCLLLTAFVLRLRPSELLALKGEI